MSAILVDSICSNLSMGMHIDLSLLLIALTTTTGRHSICCHTTWLIESLIFILPKAVRYSWCNEVLRALTLMMMRVFFKEPIMRPTIFTWALISRIFSWMHI